MTVNLYARLRQILPPEPLLVGLVTAVRTTDGTSDVRLPGPPPAEIGASVYTGPTIIARGTSVPVGARAFVRSGVIESQAPDADAVEIVVGEIVLPYREPAGPPPRPPEIVMSASESGPDTMVAALSVVPLAPPDTGPDTWTLRSTGLAYSYGGASALGGTLIMLDPGQRDAAKISIAPDGASVTFASMEGSGYSTWDQNVYLDTDVASLPRGRYAAEFILSGKQDERDMFVAHDSFGTYSMLHEIGQYRRYIPASTTVVSSLALNDVVGIVADTTTPGNAKVSFYVNGAQVGSTLQMLDEFPDGPVIFCGRRWP